MKRLHAHVPVADLENSIRLGADYVQWMPDDSRINAGGMTKVIAPRTAQ